MSDVRVLIVDDDVPTRVGLHTILSTAGGIDVVGEATDGATAIEAAQALHPDVVLLDVQLPDMSGFDVCERLRGNGSAPEVVLVSSHDASDYGPCIQKSGAAGFVTKGELSGAAVTALLS